LKKKYHRQVNENHQLHNEFKQCIEQLQTENEQLRREEIVHVEPSSTEIITG
jgi:hypothetical protein